MEIIKARTVQRILNEARRLPITAKEYQTFESILKMAAVSSTSHAAQFQTCY